MKFWILNLVSFVLVSRTATQNVECDYKMDEYNVELLKLNFNYYTCALNTANLSYGEEPKRIQGTHKEGRSDQDVKLLIRSENQILKTLTSIFCEKFRNLEAINVESMQIDTIEEDSFFRCANLKYLTLTDNKFHQLPELLFIGNPNLKEMNINNNSQLMTIPEVSFLSQEKLLVLNIYNNQLGFLPGGIFRRLVNLVQLYLDYNIFESIDPNWFKNLKSLELLELSENKITEVPPNCFKSLQNLNLLWLNNNKIQTLHPDSFFGLEHLKHLLINNNQLTDLPPGLFAPMTRLEQLIIESNQLTTLHDDSFSAHPTLVDIRLSHNKLKSFDKRILDKIDLRIAYMLDNICADFYDDGNFYKIKQGLSECFKNYQERSASPPINRQGDSCGTAKKTLIKGRGGLPWHAILRYKNGGQPFCSGVLVSTRKVVSVARCFQPNQSSVPLAAEDIEVMLGAKDLFPVEDVKINPWRNYDGLYHDAAVLFLAHKVTFNDYIQPICLAESYSGAKFEKNGFSFGGRQEGIPSVEFRDNEACNSTLGNLSSWNTFCIYSESSSDWCQEDVGSEVFVHYNGAYYLKGMFSTTNFTSNQTCAMSSYSLSTEVLLYTNWINELSKGGNKEIKAHSAMCDYKRNKYDSELLRMNFDDYTCILDTTNLDYEDELNIIEGEHEDGKSDVTVKYLKTNHFNNLKNLTSIFCEKFRNLEAISTQYMQIESIESDSFFRCANLKYLELCDNLFDQLPELLLIGNPKLKEIIIGANTELKTIPENFFLNQGDLEGLNLRDNQLKVLPSGIFRRLVKLNTLYIYNNNFESIDPNWFENLENLEQLSFSFNKITEVLPKSFKPLKNLYSLFLYYNKIQTLHPESFFGLERLKYLYLDNNPLTDLPPGLFAPLSRLQQLSVKSNQLTTVHGDSFSAHPLLHSIRFIDNEINSFDERILNKIKFQSLDLTGNFCADFLIEDDIDEVKRQLSECFKNYQERSEL